MAAKEAIESKPQKGNMLTAQTREEVEAHASQLTRSALGLNPDATPIFISDEERQRFKAVYDAQIRLFALISTRVQELFPEIAIEIPKDPEAYDAYLDKQAKIIPSQPRKMHELSLEEIGSIGIGSLSLPREPLKVIPSKRPPVIQRKGDISTLNDPSLKSKYMDEDGITRYLRPGESIDKRGRAHFRDGSWLEGGFRYSLNKPKSK